MSQRSQRILRLARLREAEVTRSKAALAEALHLESQAALEVSRVEEALGEDQRRLREREEAGCKAHDLKVRARRMPVLEDRRQQAAADLARHEQQTVARRATLAEARARQESLERYAERLADEERRELERKDQLQADELGARGFNRRAQALDGRVRA